MPPVELVYMTEAFIEAGACEAGAMGVVPLSWQEIAAWATVSGAVIDAWERTALRKMSVAYVDGLHEGAKPNSAAPYVDEEAQAARVDAKIKKAFGK